MTEYLSRDEILKWRETITTDDYSGNETLDVVAVEEILEVEPVDVIPIPDGATNGDMIMAMFGCMVIEISNEKVYVEHIYFPFDEEWWNAPYKLRELPTNVIELEPIAKEFDEFVQTKPNTKQVDTWCSLKMRKILCDYFAEKVLKEIGE